MRHPVVLLASLLALVLTALGGAVAVSPVRADPLPPGISSDPNPPGANDFSCKPPHQHPLPIVVVHGTFGDRKHLLEKLTSSLKAHGYCVFSLDYGNRATGDIATSARTLAGFVRRVLKATKTSRVSMVGHSQGGMMPRYYVKFLGGGKYVDDLVGLSPSNHGTTVLGDPDNPITGPLVAGVACTACRQQQTGSAFLTRLNRGDETPGKVSYTQISTRNDEVVVPYTSAFLKAGPRTSNITLQDPCPTDNSEHVSIPSDATAIAFVLDALGHAGPARVSLKVACGPTVPTL